MEKHPEDRPNKLTATSLVAHLGRVCDPRIQRNKEHDLVDILVIAVCTLLCAGETFNDMEDFGKAKHDWFKTFLELRNGIPSHDTFNRVFAALDPKEFLDCFLSWTQSVREAVAQEVVALDGKALRRALNKDQSVKYVVSAWAESNGLVLGQLKVSDKSNEITAVPELLRVLELSGCIVTIDAMGCQKKIAQEIIEADADYVLALKGNQERVHEEMKTFLDQTVVELIVLNYFQVESGRVWLGVGREIRKQTHQSVCTQQFAFKSGQLRSNLWRWRDGVRTPFN